jgi:hypothetical protein
LETDPGVKRFLGGPSTMSVQDYEDRIAKGASGLSTTLAVTLKNTGKYLGRCGFTEYIECAETVGWEIKALETIKEALQTESAQEIWNRRKTESSMVVIKTKW